MDMKDYKWIGLDGGDMLIRTPFISTSMAMTLIYVQF